MVDFNFNKISKQAADVAERVADVADAARGQGPRSSGGGGRRWFLLPAAAAAVYAVTKSGADLPRRAKELGRQVKERASEMPDLDLLDRVKEVSGLATDGQAAPRVQGERNRREREARREQRGKRTTA